MRQLLFGVYTPTWIKCKTEIKWHRQITKSFIMNKWQCSIFQLMLFKAGFQLHEECYLYTQTNL